MVGVAVTLAITLALAVGGVIMFGRWSRADAKALGAALRERDVLAIEKQKAEAQLQSIARELAREQAAHRDQLAAARKEVEHVRETLRRVGGDDPSVTDERLLRVAERLAARTDPRSHDGARMPGESAAGDPSTEADGGR